MRIVAQPIKDPLVRIVVLIFYSEEVVKKLVRHELDPKALLGFDTTSNFVIEYKYKHLVYSTN